MGFKKGQPRAHGAGRKAGTPNRITRTLEEICAQKGIDPFAGLLDMTQHPDPGIAFNAYKEVCKYLYPQRKAIEHSGEIKNPYLDKSIQELEQMVKEKLKK